MYAKFLLFDVWHTLALSRPLTLVAARDCMQVACGSRFTAVATAAGQLLAWGDTCVARPPLPPPSPPLSSRPSERAPSNLWCDTPTPFSTQHHELFAVTSDSSRRQASGAAHGIQSLCAAGDTVVVLRGPQHTRGHSTNATDI